MNTKLKKAKVYYSPIGDSAPLGIYWYEGPKGDAVEASNSEGVGFFGTGGELLGVIFDDVASTEDLQHLDFNGYRVDLRVIKGKVTFNLRETGNKRKKKPKLAA